MIVLVIVAFLAGIGIPAYRNHAVSARRTTATAALSTCAARLERFRSDMGTYVGATLGDTVPALPALPPVCADHAPADEPHANRTYDLSFPVSATAILFTLRATPRVGGPQVGDGFLQVDPTGLQQWDKNDDADVTDAGEDSWAK